MFNHLQTQLRSLASISMWASQLTLFPDRARSRGERASPETASSFSPSVEKPGALPGGHRHRPQPRYHPRHFSTRFWSLVSLHRWPSLRRHSGTHWRMNNSPTSGVTRFAHWLWYFTAARKGRFQKVGRQSAAVKKNGKCRVKYQLTAFIQIIVTFD